MSFPARLPRGRSPVPGPRTAACLLTALTLGACATFSAEDIPSRPVDDGFGLFVLNWQSGEQITFAYFVFRDEGKVAICGARAHSGGTGSRREDFDSRAVQSAYLLGGDQILANDISFFAVGRYERDRRPVGNARCIRTDRDWSEVDPSQPARIEMARSRFTVVD
ncbi:MAG: hypothetical protein AAFR52_14600 [Pseudomonadota bacterium]